MTRVMVTGSEGFIGRHLVKALKTRGDWVLGVDVKEGGGEGCDEYLWWDVTFPAPPQMDTVDEVYHLACDASPKKFLTYPMYTMRTGAEGTWNVLDYAWRSGAKFLLASSSEVYGNAVGLLDESNTGDVDTSDPKACYQEGKRYAEALAWAFHRSVRVDTRIARIFNSYGPGMGLDDGRVIPNFIRAIMVGEPPLIYGNGMQTRTFCHVEDTVRGLMTVMGSEINVPVNIGGENDADIYSLYRRIQRLMGDEGWQPVYAPHSYMVGTMQRIPNIVRAKGLGWQPTIGLEEGLTETIAWHLATGNVTAPSA